MFHKKYYRFAILILFLFLLPPSRIVVPAWAEGSAPAFQPSTIPAASDWDAGTLAISQGAPGEWDYHLWGGFANSLIKKGNTYYLYYQGASSYDEGCESVAQRAIGVATSTDGIHWVKSSRNPVIRWSTSQGSIEEGTASSAAWLGEDGRIYIYYGANTGSGCTVNASARLAVSENGEYFQDLGEVLSFRDPTVWGYGDELFPVGAYEYGNTWNMYYIPNGVPDTHKLGIARGDSYSHLTQTSGINSSSVAAWGPVSAIVNGPDSVLFTNPAGPSGPINIYKFDAGNPEVINLYDSYTLENCKQPSVLYESDAGRWLMLCRDALQENYFVRQANPPETATNTPTLTITSRATNTFTPARTVTSTHTSTFTATRTPTFTRTNTPTFTPTPRLTVTGTFTSIFTPPPTSPASKTATSTTTAGSPTFVDVPGSHPFYQEIEILYANGLTSGCSASPLQFCPDLIMDRAMAAVFMMRGTFGSNYVPNPTAGLFQDDWSPGTWARLWAEAMRETNLTTGCQTSPLLLYCPWDKLSREQVVIFGLKMRHGTHYQPPKANGTIFADMPDPNHWATAWAEQAYQEGLLPACGTSDGRPKFCPDELVTRGLGAYVIVRAKYLRLP